MTVATSSPTSPATDPVPTVTPPALSLLASLWRSAPLSLLLEAANARVLDSEIDDDHFMGSAIQRKDGRLFLVMPPGRPAAERDTIARDLMARMLHVPLPDMAPTQYAAA